MVVQVPVASGVLKGGSVSFLVRARDVLQAYHVVVQFWPCLNTEPGLGSRGVGSAAATEATARIARAAVANITRIIKCLRGREGVGQKD